MILYSLTNRHIEPAHADSGGRQSYTKLRQEPALSVSQRLLAAMTAEAYLEKASVRTMLPMLTVQHAGLVSGGVPDTLRCRHALWAGVDMVILSVYVTTECPV